MKTVTITKLVLTGCLKGLTLQESYPSNQKDSRIVGNVYKGYTHKYKLLSIEYKQETACLLKCQHLPCLQAQPQPSPLWPLCRPSNRSPNGIRIDLVQPVWQRRNRHNDEQGRGYQASERIPNGLWHWNRPNKDPTCEKQVTIETIKKVKLFS